MDTTQSTLNLLDVNQETDSRNTAWEEPDISAIMETKGFNARAITDKIRRAIETGTYANGEQLPPERELVNTYSASRSTIRKALNNLEDSGLVVRKAGSGTFINYTGPPTPDVESVIDQISPLHLIQARIGVERQMIRLAVLHANRRDLDQIQTVLEHMETCENDKDEFSRWDTEFHLLLARSSRNPLLVHLYEQINDVRSHAQWRAMKNLVLTPNQIRSYNVFHRQIFTALGKRDSVAAVEAISAHMDLARDDLIGAESGL